MTTKVRFGPLPDNMPGLSRIVMSRRFFLRGPESSELVSSLHGETNCLMLDPTEIQGLKQEARSAVKAAISEPPDLVIAHRYKSLFVSMMLSRDMEIGAVVGVMHEFGFLKRFTRSIYSRFWNDNVHLIGVSEPVCNEVRQQQRHLADRVHFVPRSIEAPTLLDSVSARHELGIPLGNYCFGVIGRLVEKKNHQLLIKAFAKQETDAVLALVGEGNLLSELKVLAKREGVADRVIFCGYRDDARTLMKAFDSFVFPSGMEEAFGMVLLEAMAASVPVISTDAPGPASVVGDCAMLFRSGDLDDLIAQMNTMQSLLLPDRDALTHKALVRLGKEFSINSMVQRIRNLPPVLEHAPITF